MRTNSLNQNGFTHWVVMGVFVLLFAFVGYRVLTASHAAPPTSYCYNTTYAERSSGSCVSDIQTMVNYYDINSSPTHKAIKVNGKYGSTTKTAITFFQKHGNTGYALSTFTKIGVVDSNTWIAFCKPLKAVGNPPTSFLTAMQDACGTIAPYSSGSSGFVNVCGTQLCLNGQTFVIHGATAYGTYSSPATEVALAQSGKINVLEMVEFDTQYHTLLDTMSAATWSRADQFVADAKSAGLHIILNLSEYGQSLQKVGQTPTTTDYNNYLSFIANRTNTITGVQYKNDPTIAMVEIFGEICYPGESDSTCPAGTTGTTSDMQSFFSRTENEWHALAPNILISSGGFSHLDNTDNPTGVSSGIPYQAIYSDPANPICDLEVNSTNDYSKSVPKVTSYCQQLGKPWFLSAWSSCYQDTGYPYYLATDQDMATHAQDMYNLVHGQTPSNEVAVGSDFWNLRDIGVSAGHCDLGPAYPLTWSTIQNNAQ